MGMHLCGSESHFAANLNMRVLQWRWGRPV
jgi:D-alanyl-D-alanine carboxypeptidase